MYDIFAAWLDLAMKFSWFFTFSGGISLAALLAIPQGRLKIREKLGIRRAGPKFGKRL